MTLPRERLLKLKRVARGWRLPDGESVSILAVELEALIDMALRSVSSEAAEALRGK